MIWIQFSCHQIFLPKIASLSHDFQPSDSQAQTDAFAFPRLRGILGVRGGGKRWRSCFFPGMNPLKGWIRIYANGPMVWVFYFFLEGFEGGQQSTRKLVAQKVKWNNRLKDVNYWLHVLWCLPQKPKTPRIVKLSAELEFNILKCCASTHPFLTLVPIFSTILGHKVTLSTKSHPFISCFFIFGWIFPTPTLGFSSFLLESSTTKGSKICFSSSEEHPIPVSCTVRQFSPNSVFSQRTSTWRRDWSKAVRSENYVEFFLVSTVKQSRGTCWVPIIWIETMRDSCRLLSWNMLKQKLRLVTSEHLQTILITGHTANSELWFTKTTSILGYDIGSATNLKNTTMLMGSLGVCVYI